MKRLLTFLALCCLVVTGVWAEVQKLRLSFSSITATGATVSVTDQSGTAVSGVSATVSQAVQNGTTDKNFFTSNAGYNDNVLGVNYDNSQNNYWEITFTVSGLSAFSGRSNPSIDVCTPLLTGQGAYQNPGTVRAWDRTLTVGDSQYGELSGNIENANNEVWNHFENASATISGESLTLKVKMKKTDSQGCFSGVKYIDINMPSATSADPITSISELSNTKAYTITSYARGQWTAVSGKTEIYQTKGTDGTNWGNASNGYTPIDSDPTSANQQWAILKSSQNHYYLYNVGLKKFFVTSTDKATLADTPDNSTFTITDKANALTGDAKTNYTNSGNTVRFALSIEANSTTNYFGVTDWNAHQWKVFQNNGDYSKNSDKGMYFKIVPVEDFNPSEAMAKIDLFEGVGAPITYDLYSAGSPEGATVTILGQEYTGINDQGTDVEVYKELSLSDIKVSCNNGYVYNVNVDNTTTPRQIRVSFKQVFVPATGTSDESHTYYINDTANRYVKIDGDNITYVKGRSGADKFIFMEDGNTGKYFIYDITAQKYIYWTSATSSSNTQTTSNSSVRFTADAATANKAWGFLGEGYDISSVDIFAGSIDLSAVQNSTLAWNYRGGDGYVLNLYNRDDNKSSWKITDSTIGSLACATLVFSKPGEAFMHKLVPENGAEVTGVEFDSNLSGLLSYKEDRSRYKYVSGTAPQTEGTYTYTVSLNDGTKANVTLKVDGFLQSPTPFMGWLSWNWFKRGINSDNMTAIGQGLKDKGLLAAGFNTIVLDDTWANETSDKAALDWNSTKFPNPTTFVSGIKALGFKLGLYSDAGSKTCEGYQPGSYGYETEHMTKFNNWGIDFLKYDRCNAQGGVVEAYTAMGNAIAAVNATRKNTQGAVPFVFNACEWGDNQPWTWGAEAGASSWRSTHDVREVWCGDNSRPGVLYATDVTRDYWMYTGVNRYNDLDMMCIGLHGLGGPSNNVPGHYSDFGEISNPLTTEQARSQMSLWCMFASPLSLTCDVRENPARDGLNPATTLPKDLITDDDLAILKNKDIISINQDALGQQAEYMKSLSHDDEKGTANAGGYSVYLKDLKGGKMALAIVNRSATATLEAKTIAFDQIYLSSTANYYVKDVWAGSVQQQTGNLVTDAFDASETKVYIISEEPFEEEVEPAFNIATESTVTSSQLLNGLTVTFTGANAANVQLSSTNNKAYLVKNETPAEAKAQNGKFNAPRLKAAEEMPEDAIEGTITKDTEVEGKFNINFGDATVDAGDYTVTIPEGTFYVGTEEHPVPLLTANYEVLPTFITSLDQLDNGVIYSITSYRRGALAGDDGKIYQTNGLTSSGSAFTSTYNKDKDNTDVNQQWAILKSAKGNYYLYNVGQQKFFVSNADYGTRYSRAVLGEDPNNSDFLLVDKSSVITGSWKDSNPEVRWALNMDEHYFGITDWARYNWQVFQNTDDLSKNNDEGMYFSIEPIGDFDEDQLAAAMAKIEAFEGETVVPATGYYYIKESGQYLYNDFLSHSEATQSATTKQAYDNGYVWHVTSTEGSTTVRLLNGEGSGYNSTSPNDIDLSGKGWTFEAYNDYIVPVEVVYAIFGAYEPFYEAWMTYPSNNNAAHHGGFFTLANGSLIPPKENFGYSTNVINQPSPDGTNWVGAEIENPASFTSGIAHTYYYSQQDVDRITEVFERSYEIFNEHVGKPGYCTEVNQDFIDNDETAILPMMQMAGEYLYPSYLSGDLDLYDMLAWSDVLYFQNKYLLGRLNDYVQTLEIAQPVLGDAYLIAVRGNDYTGNTKYYLKNDGSVTDDEEEADVFVMGSTGDVDCNALFVSNNNKVDGVENSGPHYLQNHSDAAYSMSGTYSEDNNALKLETMMSAEGDDITNARLYRYGTFSVTGIDGKVITFDEVNKTWSTSSDHAYMNDIATSAIELIPVEYPYNKPKLAVGNPDEHEGSYASIWLPYPMMFPDGVEVYRATDVENDGILILKQVNSDTMVAAGGYIIRDPNKSTSMTVLPAPAAPEDVTPDTANAFVGSTEDPLDVEVDGSWDAFAAKHGGTAYVLANKSNGIGYYKYNDAKKRLPKGKAIWFSNYSSDANCVQFSFGDIISAIEALHGNTGDNKIFDLQGRRLDKVQKGQVNVINGKKVMFK